MGRLIAGLMLLACAGVSAASLQEPDGPALADIEAFVSVEGNYRRLMERFLADDPTLTEYEYALLYYGFSFTEGYSPFSTTRVLEYMPREWYSYSDLDRDLAVCLGYLGREPVSIGGLSTYIRLHGWLEETTAPQFYQNRKSALIGVVERSGDGSLRRPYQIVFLRDALEILSPDNTVFLLEEAVARCRFYLRCGIETGEGEATVRTELQGWFAFDLCCPEAEDLQGLLFDDDGRPAKIHNKYD
ncbi:MAG: DUF4919 domain-containing protein [Alistipes sp.]|nr:DUF4919 domain-containing protein [Alistipes sp.]